MTKEEQKQKVKEFIDHGTQIKDKEFQPPERGFAFSFVKGPLFDTWMGEINIFNER